ncbi:AraC family transcriptional regulator [Companilactobacillus ginsenosidimutans]|uniref:AraC family transcriptional regulator n=1 Tax=Companilactobacillus ginsenosidimutans TaxID=1007676 RepID=A0A0H4QIL5_9LACO|nr:helix-turn-helix domain-containing protein [Companilactobacillus ginsenosidimutans]AKP66513.1 AraC family transcriptional regulator [Companilactobacillus ginsenosidimutans]
MNSRVLSRLKQHELVENEQLKTGLHVEDLPIKAINKQSSTRNYKVLNNYFFRNRNVYISKHLRFAPYPEHTHQFLEMNYMLSGSCDQIVDGHNVHLNKGDLLLLDVGCTHSISRLNENDILINLLFRDQSISINFLDDMRRSNSVLYDFLLNSASGEKNSLKYIVFNNNVDSDIQDTMEQIISEYYFKREFSDTIIKSYLSILLTKLVRHYHVPTDKKNPQQQLMIRILRDISENYQDIDLTTLAKKYGYNKNYLSNFIKKESGKSFSTLVTSQRLIQAHSLITTTTLPISEIIEKIGMKNGTSFYKKYKSYYLTMPGDERK